MSLWRPRSLVFVVEVVGAGASVGARDTEVEEDGDLVIYDLRDAGLYGNVDDNMQMQIGGGQIVLTRGKKEMQNLNYAKIEAVELEEITVHKIEIRTETRVERRAY